MTSEAPERLAIREMLLLLKPYLSAYVATELGPGKADASQDVGGLMQATIETWPVDLEGKLPRVVRTYLFELKDVRNRWAHDEAFSAGDVRRAAETAALVAEAIGAPQARAEAIRMLARQEERPKRAAAKRGRDRRVSQRDVMKAIYERVGKDGERAVREYADAERRGEVERRSNTTKMDAESYARALLADGMRKGWLQ